MGTSSRHDLPTMLTTFAARHASASPPVSAARLNSLAIQLGNQLARLTCLDPSGSRSVVPRNSYPHMRYILHEADGSHPQDTKESDLQVVNTIADNILNALNSDYGVTP